MGKFITKQEYQRTLKTKYKSDAKRVGLCHGVFDLVHPGHIIHFTEAKKMCDVLVVSITAADFVRKGPGRPYFDDETRLKFLEAIECIDYVMLSESYTVDDIIEAVEPDLYIKGSEYKRSKDDITGKISEEEALVKRHGGKLVFTGGAVFSSTKLINNALAAIPEDVREYVENLKNHASMKDIRRYAEKISHLKILVIGDTIIDRYSYCAVTGVMSKDMGYSARLSTDEEYLGGAAAIARHLSSFNNHVTFLTVVGEEQDIQDRMRRDLEDIVDLQMEVSHSRPTVIKQRYLTKNGKREEYRKYFEINNIPERPSYEKELKETLIERFFSLAEAVDVVFLCDFGHGMVGKELMEAVQEKSKFLILNCQTKSANKGKNIITKYHRADVFSLDQTEIGLACPMSEADDEGKLRLLQERFSGTGFLTRGSSGAYGIGRDHQGEFTLADCPALSLTVKDTVGAGDAFYAVAGLFAAVGAPIEVSTFLGNAAGALGANIVGNKDSVEKVNVLKFVNTIMNI